jgi:outer membrane lipopolysaccharide assembly protein LptE/RlpB
MRASLGMTVVLLLLILLSGCGYHTTGSTAAKLPADIHTIAIPAFINKTPQYKVEQLLTQAVVREFVSRTNYRISDSENDKSADALLEGTVVGASLNPVTYDSATGRASSAVVTVSMRVTLTDRSGKVLWQNQNYVFRDQYQISREISSFFEESSPALERVSRDFARTLVSNVLEAY